MLSYQEVKRLFGPSDRNRNSENEDELLLRSERIQDPQSYLNSDNEYELLRPDHSISGMPDNKPADEEQRLFPGSTVATDSVISLVDSFHLIK